MNRLGPSASVPTLSTHASELPPILSLAPAGHQPDLNPAVTQKRSRPQSDQLSDDEDPEETPEDRKRRRKAEANSKRQRYKHYNQNMELKRVLQLTGDLLKIEWMRSNAFPSQDEEDLIIKNKFAEALQQRGHPEDWYRLTDKDIKLLEQEDSNVRTRIRSAAALLVPQFYGLKLAPETADERSHNSEIVRNALQDARFTYADPDRLEGRFQSSLLTDIIQKAFFGVHTSIGCLYQDLLNPIPSRLIALAATAIHHVLSWYTDGTCKATAFTTDKWPQYDSFVESIEQFEQGALAHLWRLHRQRVFTRCLSVAGAVKEVVREDPIRPVTDEVLERERRRLEAIYGRIVCEADSGRASTGISRDNETLADSDRNDDVEPRESSQVDCH
ncbi:hypothetical protein BV20DRAFT_1054194 [Pilatotrama ljubarskyi]|nr:hypothetical protein BV20DRAFT_1054194 [Pilatotrama ljubarskyi]